MELIDILPLIEKLDRLRDSANWDNQSIRMIQSIKIMLLTSPTVDAVPVEPLKWFLESKIKLIEAGIAPYEAVYKNGCRYPVEDIFKQVLELVNLLTDGGAKMDGGADGE